MTEPVYISRRDKFEGAVIAFIAGLIAVQFSAVAARIFFGAAVVAFFSAIFQGGERIQ